MASKQSLVQSKVARYSSNSTTQDCILINIASNCVSKYNVLSGNITFVAGKERHIILAETPRHLQRNTYFANPSEKMVCWSMSSADGRLEASCNTIY